MRAYFYLIVLALVLASCGEKKSAKKAGAGGVTENEKTGIDEVTNFYGGTCGFTTFVSQPGGKRVARLVMSKSQTLENAASIMELNLSNIALMFYRDLKDDRKNFDEVQTSFEYGIDKHVDRSYPVGELETVLSKYPIVLNIVGVLQARNYDALDSLIDDKNSINNFDKKKLIMHIKETDTIGNIQSFVMYGFVVLKADNGKPVLHISGMMMRDKKNNEFSVDIDPYAHENKAIFINYKL